MLFTALLCGLLVYLPGALGFLMERGAVLPVHMPAWILVPLGFAVIGLRGGLFCLFPGLLLRSRRRAWGGFLVGFGLGITLSLFSELFGPHWNTRQTVYPEQVLGLIPPMLNAPGVIPSMSSNSFASVLAASHALWVMAMVGGWAHQMRPRPNLLGTAVAMTMAAFVALGSARLVAASLPEGYGRVVEQGWPMGAQMVVLIGALPASAMAAAAMLWFVMPAWGSQAVSAEVSDSARAIDEGQVAE